MYRCDNGGITHSSTTEDNGFVSAKTKVNGSEFSKIAPSAVVICRTGLFPFKLRMKNNQILVNEIRSRSLN